VVTAPIYYPVCLDVRGKRCVVVGGGKVATRKVAALVEASAEVVVVSADVCDAITERGDVSVLHKLWEESDLEGAFLVIAATNDRPLNERIALAAREKRALCNVVDDASLSDFILPAVLRRGDLLVSVSTSGALPALARRIRGEFESVFERDYAEYLDIVREIREDIVKSVPDESVRREAFATLADPRFVTMIRERGREATRRELERIVREAAHQ